MHVIAETLAKRQNFGCGGANLCQILRVLYPTIASFKAY